MPSDVSISPNGTILTAQSQALAQSQKKNANKRKLMGLEAFYSILAAALLTQNHEANSFKDKISGFLVPPKNPRMIAAAILRIYKSNRKSNMGRSAKERTLETFSNEKILKEYEDLYLSKAHYD